MDKFKKSDLDNLIKGIDLTVTMYKKAETSYKNIAQFFENNDIQCDIYPQGSFSLGTTIRPLREGKMSDYDLDFICLLTEGENKTPQEVRDTVFKLLKESSMYKDKVYEYDKCITLKFSEINEIGFNLDILPAKEASEILHIDKNFIKATNKKSTKIDWFIINPKSYEEWFFEVNSRYPQHKEMQAFMESVQKENSVQDLPDYFEKTSLQRVIQILKYHRNNYYFKRKKEDKKIISAIITSLCVQIAKNFEYFNMTTDELLKIIITELEYYSEYMKMDKQLFEAKYYNKKIIEKSIDKWIIKNPVNEDDNLADQWTNETAKIFFEWLECLKDEFLSSNKNEQLYAYENVFGKSYVESTLKHSDNFKNILLERVEPEKVKPITPWKDLNGNK